MLQLLLQLAANIYYFALHVTSSGSFPPPLSSKAEKELLEKSRNGDNDARNKLIEHNLRLVAHITKKYYASGAEPDDLISIGTIGLIKAVSTFKPDKKIRLATYAARCIENEILMFFRNIRKSSSDIPFSEPIDTDKDGNALTLIDTIADKQDVAEEIDLKLRLEHLQKIMPNTLEKREKEIITMRYGLGGTKELTQNEIAKKLGISRSYVSRIEKAALIKLRKKFDE
ncbi:MAG: RNA polymerase sporulation sigma factor SigK [Clostridia bacterium]|nr:RNA polymerase sporulation sigma factor SigK [Clostridia bacterium]